MGPNIFWTLAVLQCVKATGAPCPPPPPGRASLNARSIESAGEVQLGNAANLCGAWNALPARKRWIGVSFRADAAASARRRQVAVLAGLAHTCAATHGQSERHEWPECGLHYRRRSWHCLATARHAQVRTGLGASRPSPCPTHSVTTWGPDTGLTHQHVLEACAGGTASGSRAARGGVGGAHRRTTC